MVACFYEAGTNLTYHFQSFSIRFERYSPDSTVEHLETAETVDRYDGYVRKLSPDPEAGTYLPT